MKQIIQDLINGETQLIELPSPSLSKGHLIIRTHYTLVSSGTEKMLLNFGKASWIEKARLQPEKVQQVISKIKTDGLFSTIDAVHKKLAIAIPLGYCNVGEVIEIASDVSEFKLGDRVVSNGPHAELVCVGKNLVAKIPDEVSYEEAVFTIIASIALQGIRLVQPNLGDIIVVQGLGLIGLITAQLLKANGCKVIGIDRDTDRIKLAESWGVQCFNTTDSHSCVHEVLNCTSQNGVDAVIITASSKSNDIISNSAQMCRKRGKIVLVGVVGLELNRSDFYEKELSFQVSCSYGPGRYDDSYEKSGIDYPYAFVRWTEKRNFEAILEALKNNQLDVKPLISEVVNIENFGKVYSNLSESKSIATLLKYDPSRHENSKKLVLQDKVFKKSDSLIGIIGSGNFTSGTMLPLLYKLNAPIKTISSVSGLTATQLAKKYHIPIVSTDYKELINDVDSHAVIITTRHNTHYNLVAEALEFNKHVLVEKPLCIYEEELDSIAELVKKSCGSLTVGYNRRFSPSARLLKEHLSKISEPIQVLITMNAGIIPKEHWTQNREIGGGRIIGEACHAIDLAAYLSGGIASEVFATDLGNQGLLSDNVSIFIKYDNGSKATIQYLSSGSKDYPKERIEVHVANTTSIIDNFKSLQIFGSSFKTWSGSQDKGHKEQYRQWLKFIDEGGKQAISIESLINTSRVSFAVLKSIQTREVVRLS